MKPFEYIAPASLPVTLSQLDSRPNARLLAGGTDLIGEMKRGLASPDCVVSLRNVTELSGVQIDEDGSVVLGALTTLTEAAEHPDIQSRYPGLIQAIESIATPQIRNTGTVGGNLCQRPRCWYYRHPDFPCLRKHGEICYAMGGEDRYHAILGGYRCFYVHPSDLAPALMALDASVHIAGPAGIRHLPIEQFFLSPEKDMIRETALTSGEVLTHIRISVLPPETRMCYFKVSERKATDFALASIAARVGSSHGQVRDARLVFGGVAPIPWRIQDVETFLEGQELTDGIIEAACNMALQDATPLRQNRYKVSLAKGLLGKALRKIG